MGSAPALPGSHRLGRKHCDLLDEGQKIARPFALHREREEGLAAVVEHVGLGHDLGPGGEALCEPLPLVPLRVHQLGRAPPTLHAHDRTLWTRGDDENLVRPLGLNDRSEPPALAFARQDLAVDEAVARFEAIPERSGGSRRLRPAEHETSSGRHQKSGGAHHDPAHLAMIEPRLTSGALRTRGGPLASLPWASGGAPRGAGDPHHYHGDGARRQRHLKAVAGRDDLTPRANRLRSGEAVVRLQAVRGDHVPVRFRKDSGTAQLDAGRDGARGRGVDHLEDRLGAIGGAAGHHVENGHAGALAAGVEGRSFDVVFRRSCPRCRL